MESERKKKKVSLTGVNRVKEGGLKRRKSGGDGWPGSWLEIQRTTASTTLFKSQPGGKSLTTGGERKRGGSSEAKDIRA